MRENALTLPVVMMTCAMTAITDVHMCMHVVACSTGIAGRTC